MTYREAAKHILKLRKRPMTTAEITKEAIDKGLITPHGKTPNMTMMGVLYQWSRDDDSGEIKRVFQPGATRAMRDTVRWTLPNR